MSDTSAQSGLKRQVRAVQGQILSLREESLRREQIGTKDSLQAFRFLKRGHRNATPPVNTVHRGPWQITVLFAFAP